MRRASLLSIALFVLSVLTVVIGCDGAKPETGQIPPPSKEIKSKDGKTKMVQDKLD